MEMLYWCWGMNLVLAWICGKLIYEECDGEFSREESRAMSMTVIFMAIPVVGTLVLFAGVLVGISCLLSGSGIWEEAGRVLFRPKLGFKVKLVKNEEGEKQ